MSEEVDYAEMLEIPVSTVNVVKRKKRRKAIDLKEKVIETINERLDEEEPPLDEEDGRYAESTPLNDVSPVAVKKKKRGSFILAGEFAAACLLCAGIFLTNVFMQDSAINTFLNQLFSSPTAAADKRAYSDFTLTPPVGEHAGVSVELSPTGVMSFTGKCFVYPVCDGTVESVSETQGVYTVSLSHSDSFESIVTGLTHVYFAAGEKVKGNLPLGDSDGEKAINVMLYDNETLLSCLVVDGENGVAWKD